MRPKSGSLIKSVYHFKPIIVFPPLKISNRDREFRSYSREEREEVVRAYLYEGYSHRKLDEVVLNLDSKYSNGFQSMGILHHYGLCNEYKGLLKGKQLDEIAEALPKEKEFDFLYDILDLFHPAEQDCSATIFADEKIGFDKTVLGKVRINQSEFRKRIMTAYDSSCCVTGIHEPRMLRASHIKPWCESTETEKTDVHNGLCLNALHDCAFDCGIITVEPITYKLKLSSEIENMMDEITYNEYFHKFDGSEIKIPHPEYAPADNYLAYHGKHIFEKKTKRIKIVYETTIDQLY